MSLNTIIAFLAGIAMVMGSILLTTDNPLVFYSLSSLCLVLGGTIATLFISFEYKTAIKALKLIFTAFRKHRDSSLSLKAEIALIVNWAYIIQKSGLQGLEAEINDDLREREPFLTCGVELVVTGYSGTEIKQILLNTLKSKYEKENLAIEALKKMGGDAPAYGMLGTLIGLIIMLGNLGHNPASLGPSMAIALITTFYGIIFARLFFIPVATKTANRCDTTLFKNTLQMEGLVLLAERKSPRYIQDKINSFADSKEQFSIDQDIKEVQTAPTPPSNQ